LLQKPFDGGGSFFLSDSVVSRLEVEEFFDGEEPVAGEVLRRNTNLGDECNGSLERYLYRRRRQFLLGV
jgi:hypothetical protein